LSPNPSIITTTIIITIIIIIGIAGEDIYSKYQNPEHYLLEKLTGVTKLVADKVLQPGYPNTEKGDEKRKSENADNKKEVSSAIKRQVFIDIHMTMLKSLESKTLSKRNLQYQNENLNQHNTWQGLKFKLQHGTGMYCTVLYCTVL